MEIKYSETAEKQIKRIAKGDKKSATLIIFAIEKYAENPTTQNIKELKGQLASFKRLRVGNYRVIFDESGNIMFIYEIKHRQEAYND